MILFELKDRVEKLCKIGNPSSPMVIKSMFLDVIGKAIVFQLISNESALWLNRRVGRRFDAPIGRRLRTAGEKSFQS